MTDLTIWYEQIEAIAKHANTWCNFALVCGCVGFVLSVVAAVMLYRQIRKEENNGGGEKIN